MDKSSILKLIKRSVMASAPGATVILYGSYARGDYNKESDIDLLVLVDKDKITRNDEIKFTYPLRHRVALWYSNQPNGIFPEFLDK